MTVVGERPRVSVRAKALVVVLVLAVALLAVAGVLVLHRSRLKAQERDPARIARAVAAVSALRAGSDWRLERNATPCDFSGLLCITSKLPQRELASQVLASLRQLGARGGTVSCAPVAGEAPEDGAGSASCRAEVHLHGAVVGLWSSDYSAVGRRLDRSWAAVSVRDAPELQRDHRLTLPARSRLTALPPTWRSQLSCTNEIREGCVRYEGALHTTGSLTDLVTRLEQRVASHGYRVQSRHCLREAHSCSVVGTQYPDLNSSNTRTVVVILTKAPTGGLDVKLRASAF